MNQTFLFSNNINQSISIAYKNTNILVHPEHFIMALLNNNQSVLYKALKHINVNLEIFEYDVQNKIDKILKPEKKFNREHIKMSEELFQTIQKAKELQEKNEDEYLALDIWVIANIDLINSYSKVNKEELIKTLKTLRGNRKVLTASEENEIIKKYCTSLTLKVISGEITQTIGREKELNRLMKVLLRKNKNTPLILGEQGIGKTNLIEGLSYLIIEKKVPISLIDKTILKLEVENFYLELNIKGELEDRLKTLFLELKKLTNIILFIDDIHLLIKNEELSNLLTYFLDKIDIIGTTNYSDFKLTMEKNNSLLSKFQIIKLEEPNELETIQIMRGIKNKLEIYHNVNIEDKALISAVELSKRYITNKRFPEKVIDLFDEASSELKMDIETEPTELLEIKNTLNQLKIEKEHLFSLNKNIDEIEILIEKEESILRKKEIQYNKEKEIFFKVSDLKKEINVLLESIEKYTKNNNYKEASLLKDLTEEKQILLKTLNDEWNLITGNDSILKHSVDEELISRVISNWSGIPINKMKESESEKIIKMKDLLNGKVIGQDEVVSSISKVIQKNKAGLSDADKPIGSFLFLGTSGVGKTHMAKELAKFLFNDSSKMIRFDMSEYQDKSTISRLTGAAGLIGYEEGGQLTEAVKNNPYSVILFDEVEKAHPDIFNLLLQVLDDGRLTDNKGITVDFKNTIIILTSNIGSSKIIEVSDKTELKESINIELRKFFKPEFLNRLDDLIIFNPLTINDLIKITDLLLKDVQKKLDKRNIKLIVSDEVKSYIAEKGYNPLFGARPLRRAIDEYIEEKLTEEILNGRLFENKKIIFNLNNSKIYIKLED